MSEEMKRCPFCDEEIREGAIFCKYCKQWMPGYSYESAVRDMVLDKQGGGQPGTLDLADLKNRDQQLELVLKWADSDKTQSFKGFDLSVQELNGVDLSGADLQEADLRDANLSGANLSGANLSKANLYSANLRGANLEKANLTETYLREAVLEKANLSRAVLLRVNLLRSFMDGANMYRVDMENANLKAADLRDVNFRECYMKDTQLGSSKLEGAIFSGALLIRTDFTASDVTSFQYRRAATIEDIVLPSGHIYGEEDN